MDEPIRRVLHFSYSRTHPKSNEDPTGTNHYDKYTRDLPGLFFSSSNLDFSHFMVEKILTPLCHEVKKGNFTSKILQQHSIVRN